MRSRCDAGDAKHRYRALLSGPHLSVISAELDPELDAIARTVTSSLRIEGRAELEALFGALLAAQRDAVVTPKTLDLLGHSTARTAQLRLGDWVIDARDPSVIALCRELVEREALPRLGIRSVRLLGCRTADTVEARATICRLAELLEVEVLGTRHLLYGVHYDDAGFREVWEFLLVSATELARAARGPATLPAEAPWPRTLDLEAIPALPLGVASAGWPRRVATAAAAHGILQLLRRDAGAQMPGLVTSPSTELALPSSTPGAYHLAHVLFDGAFLRFFPDGLDAPGVVYPVDDARALGRIIDELPPAAPR